MNWVSRLAWRIVRAWGLRRQAGLEVGSFFPAGLALRDAKEDRLWPLPPAKKSVLWFTNLCEDCRLRAPLLEDLRRTAGDRLAILAISILPADDPLPKKLAAEYGFPILLDWQDVVTQRLGLAHPPGTCPLNNLFLLDEAGRILFRHHLSALSPEAFRQACVQYFLPSGE